MPVYVISASNTDMAKIGWAEESAESRCRQLQAGCWETLNILRVLDGDRLIEAWMHRHFKVFHVSRDWFRFHSEMLTIEPPTIDRAAGPHMSVILAFGSKTHLAKAIGVDPSRAIHWDTRGIPARYWPAIETSAVGQEIGATAVSLSAMAA